MPARPPIIAVCGAGQASREVYALAEEVGRRLAQAGATVISGGLGGVMEACCRGAQAAGGRTIGILPGEETRIANPYVDVPIATGMAEGRNVVIIHTADAIIALPGSYGTLSEVAYALIMGKPVVSLGSWTPDETVISVDTPEEAVARVLTAIAE